MKKIIISLVAACLYVSNIAASDQIQINHNEFIKLKQEFFVHKKSHKRLKKIVYYSLIAISLIGTGIIVRKWKNKDNKGK